MGRSERARSEEAPADAAHPAESAPNVASRDEAVAPTKEMAADKDAEELELTGQESEEAIVPALRAAWAERGLDVPTRSVLVLVLIQFVLTIYAGGLSAWSVTGFLWLLVVYGVWDRASWALVLPLVLFTLDVALLLFGIGPRERAGFLALTPLDSCVYLIRFAAWALIWRVRDELA